MLWAQLFTGIYVSLFCCFGVEGWNCLDGIAIDDGWLCDGRIDCLDGSDELPESCVNRACEEDQFRCNNTRCIHMSFRCDGEFDCDGGDESDEVGCQKSIEDAQCENMFRCRSGVRCIPLPWRCDGERDCSDHSDEFDCPCKNDTYGCYVQGQSLCLKNATKCDGIRHCDNGEDEGEKCLSVGRPSENVVCPRPGMFKCRSGGACIPWRLVCDDLWDCKDRSDEGGLCHVSACGQKGCGQYCHESPDGGVCYCGDGFRLAKNGVHCQDIDECSEMLKAELDRRGDVLDTVDRAYEYGVKKLCSQQCVNSHGGFHCSCAEGYLIDADGFTCKAQGHYQPDLFAGVDNEIRVFSLREPGDKTLYYDELYRSGRNDESIVDVDMHVGKSVLYWAESVSGQLKMKKNSVVFPIRLDFKPSAVCVDWITGNLFVSTEKKDPNHVANLPAIFVLSVSTSTHAAESVTAEILSTILQSPVALAIYPQKGILLIADAGFSSVTAPRIIVANTDGSHVRNLVTDDIFAPTDVVVDYVNDVVFWSSKGGIEGDAKVERVSLDGTGRMVVLSMKLNQFPLDPVSIATFEGSLYVSDNKAKEVRSLKTNEISLYGDENTMYSSESVIKHRHSRMGSILISHPVLQQELKGTNPCDSAECSRICVLAPKANLKVEELLQEVNLKAQCICPPEFPLQADGKTCKVPSVNIHTSDKKIFASTSEQLSTQAVTEPAAFCLNPGLVKNAASSPMGVLNRESLAVGTTIWYTCYKGYVLKGFAPRAEFDITCTHGGRWSASLLECVKENLITKILKTLKTPRTTKQPREPDVPRSTSDLPTRTRSQQQICSTLNCEPWGVCVKGGGGGFKCACSYGESTSDPVRCLPPPHTASANSTAAAMVSATTPFREDHGLTPSMTALIVLAVLLSALALLLCCRCMRKKSYSVDLRHIGGKIAKASFNKSSNRESAVIECSLNGRPASITNPNYTSPSQRRRLPKPALADDLSVCDSGIQRSFGSGSPSNSDNSIGEVTSGSASASEGVNSDCALLSERRHEELPNIDESELETAGHGRFQSGFEDFFKIRRTESRECMLPKTRKLK